MLELRWPYNQLSYLKKTSRQLTGPIDKKYNFTLGINPFNNVRKKPYII